MIMENIFEQYYSAHQISKSVNIIDIAMSDNIDEKIMPTQCICNFLQPVEGWNRYVKSSGAESDRCYHCLCQLSSKFPDFSQKIKMLEGCKVCYLFVCKKYVQKDGGIKLAEKFTKKNKAKIK